MEPSRPTVRNHVAAARGSFGTLGRRKSGMADLQTTMSEALAMATAGRGAASASIISHAGAEPQTSWIPQSEREPAFLAYSITKVFIAVSVLRLCEHERLRLDDRLARWFPHIAEPDRISIRQLLNHTAGIPDYGAIPAYHDSVRAMPSAPWSFERFTAETFDKGLRFEPGEGWAYSTPGYMLVKRIVEDAAGKSFRDLVADDIANPLGLQRTFVPESIDDLASLAPGMSRALSPEATLRDVRQHYHPAWVSHGVVAGTSSDIVRFLDQMFSGQILSADSLDQMTALVAVPVDPPAGVGRPSYGLGLMGDPASSLGLLLGHNGAGPGYSASAFHAGDLNGASVCVMGAIEDRFDPREVVLGILSLASDHNHGAAQHRAGADSALT